MNFATTKERILQYLDYKGISTQNFFIQTSIRRGFLDSDKLKASVSDVFLAKIIATYEDLSIHWLITGKGTMIVKKDNYLYKSDPNTVSEPKAIYSESVQELKTRIEQLNEEKAVLYRLLESNLGNAKTGS